MRGARLPGLAVLVPVLLGLAAARPVAAEPLGDCGREPALASRTDVVYCEPWESADWWRSGYTASGRLENPPAARDRDVARTSIETGECVAGSCLRVQAKQFVSKSLSLHWPLKNAGLRPEQLHLRYYLKLGPTWNNDMCRRSESGEAVKEGQGGKLPGLADVRDSGDPGGQCGNGGAEGDGIRCWSHRGGFRDCSGGSTSTHVCRTVPGGMTRFHGYVYFPGQERYTGNAALWDGDPWGQFFNVRRSRCATEPRNLACAVGGNRGVLARERWYAIEQFVKMNTPGAADGVIRGWVDGKLAYEKTNMIFRLPGHQGLHVRTVWLDVYKGGLYGNCADGEIWLDQLVVATDAPIGVIGAAPTAPAPR